MFGPKPEIKTHAQLAAMAEAGAIVYDMLTAVEAAAEVGITTGELDAIAERVCREAGAKPNFLGYHGYPATVCLSVNEEIVHGIPGERVLRDGDVVSVDGGCSVAGPSGRRWHGDSARTFIVGTPRAEDLKLSEITREAMWQGIAALAGAKSLNVVGKAVQRVVEDNPVDGRELGIVREYVGHGIGSAMHQPPDVVNYASPKGPKIKSGMAVCVEPMLVLGSPDNETLDDDWTVVTLDGSRASHWEHAVALVDGGVRVLTLPDGGAADLARYGVTPIEL